MAEATAVPDLPPYAARRYRDRWPGGLVLAIARDLLDGVARLDRTGGDLVRAESRMGRLLLIRHPDLIRALLVERNEAFTKARGLRLASLVLGRGLLTSEPPFHTRQRRLVLPAFHHARLRAYAGTMVALADAEADTWASSGVVHAEASMNRLALAIAGQTLFGADVLGHADRIGAALREAFHAFDRAQHPLGEVLARLPLPNARRTRRARAVLDALVYGLIAERRKALAEGVPVGEDLLGLLLEARDEASGEGMTDLEVRDEAMTLLLAGHETTANALTWTWALLAQHAHAEALFHAEVDRVLEGRAPTVEDVPRLAYTRQVLAESMRLYPPAWVVGRQAARDTDLCGEPVPEGSTLLFAPYFLHRDPRFWDAPERFEPARFEAGARLGHHKFAYLPFSAGRRGCIGEQFAWMEGVLVLAAIGRRLALREAGPFPVPHGSVTLRPEGPMPLVAVPR